MKQNEMHAGAIIRDVGLSMQVCVPKEWTDEQILEFVEIERPCGFMSGWQIAKTGHDSLCGHPERVKCAVNPLKIHAVVNA